MTAIFVLHRMPGSSGLGGGPPFSDQGQGHGMTLNIFPYKPP